MPRFKSGAPSRLQESWYLLISRSAPRLQPLPRIRTFPVPLNRKPFHALGPKAIPALDDPDFEDREPNDGPRPLGQIAGKGTQDIGVQAFRHWLVQAAQAKSDDERETALEIASEIANLMGLDADLIGRRAT